MSFGTILALLYTLVWPAAAAVSLAFAVSQFDVTWLGMSILVSGTMAGYGLDRLIDRRQIDLPETRRVLLICVAAATLATVGLALIEPWRIQICALLGVMAGGYVPLKRIIPKNLLTAPAWTIAVCVLPPATLPEFDSRFFWSILTVALIMLTNTVLCDLPNIEEDRRAGVRSFTVRFDYKAGAIFARFMALFAVFAGIRQGNLGLILTAMGLIPVAILMQINPHRRGARQMADLVVTIIPGPVTLLLSWLMK